MSNTTTTQVLADIPDGMTVTAIHGPEEGPALAFYTGRWTIQYDVREVRRLVASLSAWIATLEPVKSPGP